MIAGELLSRLKAVRRSGDVWIARCPAHEDHSPSLSVRESNGRILLHCFAGCDIRAVCAAVRLKVADLFSGPATFEPRPDVVRTAEKQIADLRSRLTPRERVLPVTVVYCGENNLDEGMARALALAVEGELAVCALKQETECESAA